jgi:hypothetical protein
LAGSSEDGNEVLGSKNGRNFFTLIVPSWGTTGFSRIGPSGVTYWAHFTNV